MGIEWKGDLTLGLEHLREMAQSAEPDLLEGAKVIMDRSQELVPHAPKRPGDDTPTLASTAKIEPDGHNKVALKYTSVYAHWIHEHLWFMHPHGGQAKFLETAMIEKGEDALYAVARHLFGRL
jgi:hypothetical protein